MVKKKAKTSKSSKRRGSWQNEEVQVNTGLPPQVEGQLRCFCRLSVGQILWHSPHPPNVVHVRVKWWGEDGDGALFCPPSAKKDASAQIRTTARYPVRSGPKQFASYLNDMGSLILEVLNGPMLVPVGQAEVSHVGLLSPTRPINGFYPVISPREEKIAELQVSMMLESLMASYDSTGSIPTTDISTETRATQESMYPQKVQPIPHSQAPRKPVDDPFISPASQTVQQNGYTGAADDLRKQLNYSIHEAEERQLPTAIQSGSTVAITTNGDVVTTNLHVNGAEHQQSRKVPVQPSLPLAQAGNGMQQDLLSVLLERGNRLRNQMVISEVNDDQTTLKEPFTAGLPSVDTAQSLGINPERRSSTGSLLKEILKAEKGAVGGNVSQLDDKAIDLVFGDQVMDDLQVLKMMGGSPRSSVSEDLDLISDPGDPIHSESILQELFYKNPDSEMSGLSELSGDEEVIVKHQHKGNAAMTSDPTSAIENPDNVRPPSRRSSCSSLTFPEFTESEVPSKPKEKRRERSRTPTRKPRLKLKRKGSKKRQRSRSSGASCGSDYSDSEQLSTPRSEMSQVSFDMPASDIDEPEEESAPVGRGDGLSVERLTLLGRVHVARVTIDKLHLSGSNLNSSTSSKKKRKMKTVTKPPKPSPKSKKSVTYFIEYQFPVVATSRDKYSPNAMATEVMRVASKNVKDGVVMFSHRSVFPIMFDGSAVEKWWKSALIFKLYSRTAGQKVPSLVGSCGVPLKSILKSDNLHLDKALEIRESGRNTSLNSSLRSGSTDCVYGSLKVAIELASDSRDFSSALARAKLAEMSGKAKIVPIPQAAAPVPPPVSVRPPLPPDSVHSAAQVSHVQQPKVLSQLPPVSNNETGHFNTANTLNSHQTRENEYLQQQQQFSLPAYPEAMQSSVESMTLHTLLLIPEGQNITLQGVPSLLAVKRHPVFPPQPHSLSEPGIKARDASTRNTYLVCRMFWCNDAVHSNVCWGSFQPQFNFVQIAPVLMSTSLLERMRNNFMVVEVWDKKTSAENDRLIGIVKLSLHQFYMSFRDRKISNALLKSQFPVISVDNFLPIVDPVSGSQFGQVKVLLAMGSAEQIAGLQRLKLEGPNQPLPERPQHYLERQDLFQQNGSLTLQGGADGSVEHLFEIVMEGIRGLSLFENMIWGEADCFIQYHFPVQSHTEHMGARTIKHGIPSMKSFRTATTLCVPDPTFNDVTRHRLILPQATPVQRELLTACAGAGGGGGGIPFEVWCRYYHPNIRDQCIAKASLPLAKLCAMVTMQKRGEPSVQSFALQLSQIAQEADNNDSDSRVKMKESGLMDVTVHYRTQVVQNDNEAANKNLMGSQVCVSVGVIRASGLKAAAEAVARLDSGMQYPSEVGINAYVKVLMSFLGKGDERITRTIARTFAPDFSHHMDFPCPLLWTEADSDALAFAEILETAEVTFEMWHQVPGLTSDIDRHFSMPGNSDIHGKRLVDKTADVLLGTTTVPLSSLLTHRTGILGWYAVNLPSLGWGQNSPEEEGAVPHSHGLDRVVGGIELSIKFAHHDDRERVIHAGRGVGWSPVDLDVEDDEDWQSEDEDSGKYSQISVSMDQISFPLQNALIAGQSQLDRTARCYVRYKLYDKNAVVSKASKLDILDSGYILTDSNHRHDFHVPISSPFKWYLREEKLEVQIWVSYGRKEQKHKPQHRDKLIGTAYIDLESLSDERRRQHRVSGMYPLFKPGASSLGGAFLRAHITAKPHFGNVPKESDVDDEHNLSAGSDVDAEYDSNDSFHQLVSRKKPAKIQADSSPLKPVPEDSIVPNFSVVISVERAMHLPHICDKNRSEEYLPNTYVSYQTAENLSPSYTQVFFNTDNPVWDHQHETKLSTELLFQENKNLVFKVWHKPHSAPKDPDKSSDRVLGFVSVDLTPLASGMMQICGWYNVMDFNGQCRGQIKVNVVPQENVTGYREGMQTTAATTSIAPQQPSSLPYEANAPLWLSDQPLSLPTNLQPFSSNLPQFDQHVDIVREQHEQLQSQLTDHIRQFLQQQEAVMAQGINSVVTSEPPVISAPQPLPHWQPNYPQVKSDDSNTCSRSIMFTSLRKQMQDLDDITNRLKMKLGTPTSAVASFPLDQVIPQGEDVPVAGLGHMTMTSSQSGVSPLSSLQFTSTRKQENDLMQTGSHGEGESSQTVVDSGAFSVTHSSEKYQDHDALDSQRSGSDKLDTLLLGTTSRDYIGQTDTEANINQYAYPQKERSTGSTPRDSQNNSDTGVNMHFTPRDDISVSTGGFNMGYTPRDPGSVNGTPRDTGVDMNYSTSHISDPSSLGFVYHGETSHGNVSSTGIRNTTVNQNGSIVSPRTFVNGNHGKSAKDMSIIQEYTENEEDSDGGEDEKYYHQYRDILDEQEHSSESEENDHDIEGEGEVVVPRTLNDVSGKFGGIPGHSVVLGGAFIGSPREFHQTNSTNGEHTMPFDVRGSIQSNQPSRGHSKLLSDEEDDDHLSSGQRSSPPIEVMERPSFVEKDSWFSDDEKENDSSHFSAKNKGNHYSSVLHGSDGEETKVDDYLDSDNRSSRGSSAGKSRSNASSGQSVHSDKEKEASVSKSTKQAYSSVVTELEDYFTKPQGHPESYQRSRSPSISSVNCNPRPHSPANIDVKNDLHNEYIYISDSSDDEAPEVKCNGFGDETRGGEHSNGVSERSSMPNFFMPMQHLEESMKALQMATSGFPASSHKADHNQPLDTDRRAGRIKAAAEMKNKLESSNATTKFTGISTKGRQPPTAAETKRIAKIFSAKFT